jgi:hypothetical protein
MQSPEAGNNTKTARPTSNAFAAATVRSDVADNRETPLLASGMADNVAVPEPDEDEMEVPVTWSTRLFLDACKDWSIVAEVLLCHPCNISAQFTAALGNDDDSPASTAPPSPVRQAVPIGGPAVVRDGRRGARISSDSDSEQGTDSAVLMQNMRDTLPPLNVIPCVAVVVLDVLYCGAGSMLFSYWLRNELAQKFSLVPDVGHLPTDDLHEGYDTSESDDDNAADAPIQIGRPVYQGYRRSAAARSQSAAAANGAGEAADNNLDNDDTAATADGDDVGDYSFANGSEQQPRRRAGFKQSAKDTARAAREKARDMAKKTGKAAQAKAKEMAKEAQAKAKEVAKATEITLRRRTKRAARRSAEYLHSSVASCICFPCALCQTHRELELRGLKPVRYLSATKLAAAYATSSLSGGPNALTRVML